MAKRKESTLAPPIRSAEMGAFAGEMAYAAPEFKTLSAAARPKKRANKRAPKPIMANETKPFTIDDLFLTDC